MLFRRFPRIGADRPCQFNSSNMKLSLSQGALRAPAFEQLLRGLSAFLQLVILVTVVLASASLSARAGDTSILTIDPPDGAIVTLSGPGLPTPLLVTGYWRGAMAHGIYSVKVDARPPWKALGAFGSGGFSDPNRTTFDLTVSAPHVQLIPRISTSDPNLSRQRVMDVTFAGRADAGEANANMGHPRTPGGNVTVAYFGQISVPRGATPPRILDILRVGYFGWYGSFDLLPTNPDRVDLHLRRLSNRYGQGVISIREVLPGGKFEPASSNSEPSSYEYAPPTRSVPGGEGLVPNADGLVVMDGKYFYNGWRDRSIRRAMEIGTTFARTEAVYAGPANSNRDLAPKFRVTWTEPLLQAPIDMPVVVPPAAAMTTPRVIAAPVPLNLREGDSSALEVSVTPANGTSYLWRKNGVPIPGATGARLPISSVTLADQGTYSVVASNSAGSAMASATVKVLPKIAPPSLTTQPANTRAEVGQPFALSVSATGDGILYQWFKDGTAIAGEKSSSLHRQAAVVSDSGDYFARVSNEAGSVSTLVVSVSVSPAATPPPAPTPTPPAPIVVAPRPTSPAQPGTVTTPKPTPAPQPPTIASAPKHVPVAIAFRPQQGRILYRGVPFAVLLAVIDAGGRVIGDAPIFVDDPIGRQTRVVTERSSLNGYVADIINLPAYARSGIYTITYSTVTSAGKVSATLDVIAYAPPLPGEKTSFEFDAAEFGGLGRFAVQWPVNPSLATPEQRRAQAAFLLDRLHDPSNSPTLSIGDALQLVEIITLLTPLGAARFGVTLVARTIIRAAPIGIAQVAKARLTASLDPTIRANQTELTEAIDHAKNAWGGIQILADGNIGLLDIAQAVDGLATAVISSAGEIIGMDFTRQDNASTSVVRITFAKPVKPSGPARFAGFSGRVELGAVVAPTLGVQLDGAGEAPFLLRGVGPALAVFAPHERAVVRNPRIALAKANRIIATNDDWLPGDFALTHNLGAPALATGSLDAALAARLGPGGYTATLGGEAGNPRAGWIEFFGETWSRPRATSFTLMTHVSEPSSTIVPRLRISGKNTARVLVRAAGPVIAILKVPSVMADPAIEIVDASGSIIASNDDWETAAGKNPKPPAEVAAAALRNGLFPFTAGSRAAALLVDLPAGDYAIKLRGSGVVLLEVVEAFR